YLRREIEYPVEYALDMTVGQSGTENVYALGALVDWANNKYRADLSVEDFRDRPLADVRKRLVDISEAWMTGGRMEESIRADIGDRPDPCQAVRYAKERFDTELLPADFDGNVIDRLAAVGRRFLRREMTELERFVLLQIYDASWKDHLLAMDHLKSGIGLRSYAEQDPRVAYKTEGAELFTEMLEGVRDKVTDMIFKVRIQAGAEVASVYEISSMVHEQLSGYDHLAQELDGQRQAAAERQKVETIVRSVPKVGRNDPCPCGSGKKYKKCCGKGL
ncbi:MAG: SEC-C domain-containing protein, partial [Planctomycetes bacterium]|nr:SEC-C domain-containing protein [Planctomycetota bacterium]